ncbi:hypothetical protein N9N67_08755 [Bacteriovoracaceae bacterium]|nr:hypothetical protein [Bacteriovoracaceae bacterium]
MRKYLKEVKDFYKFVSSNFSDYKRKKVKSLNQAVIPKRKAKTKVDAKVKNRNRKRKVEITPIRRVN